MKKGLTNILLLNPPWREPIIRDYYCCFTSKSGYLWPPTDLLILSGVLKKHANLKVIDAVVEKLSEAEVIERTKEFNPKVIVALTGTVSWKEDFVFLERLVKLTKAKLFVSGNITLFRPKYFLQKYPFLFGILHNFASSDILYFLEAKRKKATSISCRQNGKIIIGERNSLHNDFGYPPPQHTLFPLDKYRTPIARSLPMTTVLISFGCPFNCLFCIGSTLNIKLRRIDNIMDELRYLQKIGVKEIFFKDCCFNADLKRAQQLCQKIIKENLGFHWTCDLHSKMVDEKTLSLMKKAGCHTVQIGVESVNNDLLKKYCPSKQKSAVKKAFCLCHQLGLKTLAYFIVGLPGETTETGEQTISFAKELNPTYVSFSVATPDYGTSLRKMALKSQWIKPECNSFDSSGKAVLATPLLSKKETNRLVTKAYRSFYLRPLYLGRTLFSKRSWPEIKELIKEGMRLIIR